MSREANNERVENAWELLKISYIRRGLFHRGGILRGGALGGRF